MFAKLSCWIFGHGNLVRERNDQGELCYRCEDCFTLLPNSFNKISGTPVESEYKAAKVGESATPASFKLEWGIK